MAERIVKGLPRISQAPKSKPLSSNSVPESEHVKTANKSLDAFLKYTEKQYDSIYLYDQGQPSAPLFDVFVPTPTNYVLNVEVKNDNIVTIEEERQPSEDVALFQRKAKFNYDADQVDCFREKLEKNIREGKEYNYPDTSLRPLIISAPQADGKKTGYWSLNVFDIISLYNKVVLLGKPGTGKSTALRYLTINLIRNHFGDNCDGNLESLSNVLFEKNYIPIYIEFRKLTEWWIRERKTSNILASLIIEYITSLVKDESNIVNLDNSYNYIFIFDGIDEICSPTTPNIKTSFGKQALNNLVASLKRNYKTSKFLFASRISEYADWQLEGFEVSELAYMSDFLSAELIRNICDVLGNPNKDTPDRLISDMRKKGFGDDVICNPMLLSLLTSVALKDGSDGVLPSNKTEILREGINLLLNRWAIKGEQKPEFFTAFEQDSHERNKIFEQLEEFAYNQNENGSINVSALLQFFRHERNANEILEYLSKQVGLIVEEGNSNFKFAHKSFRSYLAAAYIVRQTDRIFQLILDDIERKLANTHETTFLAIDLLFDRSDGIYVLSTVIMELLSGTNLNSDWCIWFAAKILFNRHCLLYNALLQKKSPYLPILKSALLRCFSNKNGLPQDKRIECGKFLGYFGDIRCGTGEKDGMPEILWCRIDGGDFSFGINESTIRKISQTPWGKIDFSREQTSSKQTVPLSIASFEISKYPITVAQFETFLKEKDGYFNEKWFDWSDLARDYFKQKHSNRFLGTNNFHGICLPSEMQIPNYPMTNVTFFDAVAFCKWLSSKTGSIIRLPSEMEVEYAAKSSGNCIFEWGDNFDPQHWDESFVINNCNCIGTKIGHVCSVGAFNDNIDDFPVDLTGNTWEWTQSYFSDTLDGIEDNMIINLSKNELISSHADAALIGVRGGSVHNGINCMRVSFRGRDPIRSEAKDRHSFRVVRLIHDIASIYDESIFLKQSPSVKVAEGYGLPVKRGDEITILYYVLKENTNEYVQEQADFSFILGNGVIHRVIENELLMGHRVACNIRLSLNGRDLFGDNGYFDRVHPNDKLSILVHIKDVVET